MLSPFIYSASETNTSETNTSCTYFSLSLKGCHIMKNLRLFKNMNHSSVYIIVITVYVESFTEWHTNHFRLEATCCTSSVKELLCHSVYLLQVYCMCNSELVSHSDIHVSPTDNMIILLFIYLFIYLLTILYFKFIILFLLVFNPFAVNAFSVFIKQVM